MEESTSDEESEEEEDLIGYKGKAPTQLLMEVHISYAGAFRAEFPIYFVLIQS